MRHIPDLQTFDLGTVVSLTALTKTGHRFMRAVGDGRPSQYADHRFATDIMCAALRSGLTLRDAASGRLARPGAERRLGA